MLAVQLLCAAPQARSFIQLGLQMPGDSADIANISSCLHRQLLAGRSRIIGSQLSVERVFSPSAECVEGGLRYHVTIQLSDRLHSLKKKWNSLYDPISALRCCSRHLILPIRRPERGPPSDSAGEQC